MRSTSVLTFAMRTVAFGVVLTIVWALLGETPAESWSKALGGLLGWTLVDGVRFFRARRQTSRR